VVVVSLEWVEDCWVNLLPQYSVSSSTFRRMRKMYRTRMKMERRIRWFTRHAVVHRASSAGCSDGANVVRWVAVEYSSIDRMMRRMSMMRMMRTIRMRLMRMMRRMRRMRRTKMSRMERWTRTVAHRQPWPHASDPVYTYVP
jgi:hypothetical protein